MSTSSYLGSKVLPMLATLEGSSIDNGIYLLSASSDWMDFFEFMESGMTGSGGGGLSPRFFQLLELCGCRQSAGHLAALLVAVIGLLDASPNGDGPPRSWHLQYQVGVVRNRHELGECRPS
jgi:hypothetical protein